jgi:hypothetical protein
MDRTFTWLRSREGKKKSYEFRVFGYAEVYRWITEAKTNNMISEDQANALSEDFSGKLGKIPLIGENLAYNYNANILSVLRAGHPAIQQEKARRKDDFTILQLFTSYFKESFKSR